MNKFKQLFGLFALTPEETKKGMGQRTATAAAICRDKGTEVKEGRPIGTNINILILKGNGLQEELAKLKDELKYL